MKFFYFFGDGVGMSENWGWQGGQQVGRGQRVYPSTTPMILAGWGGLSLLCPGHYPGIPVCVVAVAGSLLPAVPCSAYLQQFCCVHSKVKTQQNQNHILCFKKHNIWFKSTPDKVWMFVKSYYQTHKISHNHQPLALISSRTRSFTGLDNDSRLTSETISNYTNYACLLTTC